MVGLLGAAALGRPARAADKIVGGTLGGQAPLWPFYIAAQKGFFAGEDLDVEINFAQSGAAVTQQLTGGAFDVVLSVGISDPIHAIDKGAALALIRIIGNAPPYILIGKPGLKTIADLKGKTVSVGQVERPHHHVLGADGGGERIKARRLRRVDRAASLRHVLPRSRPALPMPRSCCRRSISRPMPQGYVTLGFAADYVKDLPFTGMAVRRDWAQAHAPLAKRLLAATDKSIAWFADDTHRGEAIDLLVSAAHARKEDADASYDLLRRIEYFEPSSKVSRRKLQNLIDVERKLGTIDASFTPERLVMPGVTELVD